MSRQVRLELNQNKELTLWEQFKEAGLTNNVASLESLARSTFDLGPSNISVSRTGKERRVKAKDFANVSEEWKSEAFYYYENMPEVQKVINVTARSVGACDFEVGWQRPEGTLQAIEDDPELNLLVRTLEGPGGGIRQISEMFALNMQITGDGYLIAAPIYDERGTKIVGYEDWEFVSVDELSMIGKDSDGEPIIQRNSTGGVNKFNFYTGKEFEDDRLCPDSFIARCWRRSPRYSQLSTSALRPNLRLCKLITKLDDIINAVANSQLPGGILIVPEDASFGPSDPTVDGGDMAEDILDPLDVELWEHLSAAVEDRSSSESLAPLVLRLKAELAKEVRYLRISRDMDSQTSAIREELHKRLAIGLDAPRETLEGKGQANNWSGFLVDSNFASHHVIPLGYLIADFLTRCYLWPMLEKMIADGNSNKDLKEVRRYRFIFNPKNIIARVDKATLAIKLFERGILSEKATALAAGFELKDLRSVDERRQALIIDLFKASPVTLAPVLLPLIDGLEHLKGLLPVVETPTAGANQTKPPLQDSDGRGPSLPRQTPDPGTKGEMPDPSKINKERQPGGSDEDRRNPLIEKLTTEKEEEFALFFSQINDLLESKLEEEPKNKYKFILEESTLEIVVQFKKFLDQIAEEYVALHDEIDLIGADMALKYLDSFYFLRSIVDEPIDISFSTAFLTNYTESFDL